MKQKLQNIAQKVKKPDLKKVRAKHVHIAVGSTIAVIALVVSGATWYFHSRAFPGVKVANMSVSGKSRNDVKKIIETQRDAMKVHFVDHGTDRTVAAKDLGVNVDVDKTTNAAMDAGRNGGFWRAVQFWMHEEIPLTATTDIGVFKDYVVKTFPSIVKDAKDAEITFNEKAKKFEVIPGKPGQGFDIKKFEELLPKLTSQPQTMKLAVSSAPLQPLIQDSTLAPLKEEANQRLTLSLKFAYKGKVMYFADPEDIAKWISFKPDPQTGKVITEYDKAKVSQFLTKQVGPAIAAPPVDKKVIKDPNNGSEVVIQQGQIGRQVKDVSSLTDEVIAAISKNQPLQKEIDVTEAPYKTVTLTGADRWVEVDLSEQRTTLYTGATPVRSFTISSGLARTPTVTGEFKIWLKNASQTMTGGSRASGDHYYLPNVTWVSYFYQDYSFHTAYWHNNFGTPMSHGCVNMRQADAKALYDFAPIGTKVIVHK